MALINLLPVFNFMDRNQLKASCKISPRLLGLSCGSQAARRAVRHRTPFPEARGRQRCLAPADPLAQPGWRRERPTGRGEDKRRLRSRRGLRGSEPDPLGSCTSDSPKAEPGRGPRLPSRSPRSSPHERARSAAWGACGQLTTASDPTSHGRPTRTGALGRRSRDGDGRRPTPSSGTPEAQWPQPSRPKMPLGTVLDVAGSRRK